LGTPIRRPKSAFANSVKVCVTSRKLAGRPARDVLAETVSVDVASVVFRGLVIQRHLVESSDLEGRGGVRARDTILRRCANYR